MAKSPTKAVDGEGRPINIEVQNAAKGASPRRARFHSAVIDNHSLEKGQDFDELPDHYILFITGEDILGLGRMIYTIHRYIDGELQPFDDGSHIIYVNTSAQDDGSDLAKLIHDLRCPNPDKMHFPNLAARVEQEKENLVLNLLSFYTLCNKKGRKSFSYLYLRRILSSLR